MGAEIIIHCKFARKRLSLHRAKINTVKMPRLSALHPKACVPFRPPQAQL